jgi:phosphonate metabolism protein (transferase hexapeptide repeat family)
MYDFELLLPEGTEYKEKKLGENPTVHPTATVRKSKLGSWTDIGPGVVISESEVGDYTYFAGDASVIYSKVGKYCSIASHVRLNPGNHPSWRVMQHHCTYRRVRYGFDTKNDDEFFNWRKEDNVEIGHDVWLGHGVLVMAGVKIGTGSVIGSGSVVTKDIAPYSIAVGVPARVIRKRFNDQTIEKLLKSEWWDWDRKTLEERFRDFLDLESFLNKYCGGNIV